MIKEIIASGKDVLEAQENARAALGAGPLDDVKFEIIHAGSRGIFGIIGVKPAQVKASMEIPDAPEKRPKQPKPQRQSEGAGNNNNNNNQGHGNQSHGKQPRKKPHHGEGQRPQQPAQQAPREAVIPESDIKMERLTPAAGEDMSYDFVKTLVLDLGINADVEIYRCDDGTRRIVVVGEDASTLIGHHGETLDALQYLANLASAKKNASGERDKSRVTIDIEGYRAKREETLRALARRMAQKAIRNRRSVMLEPMSAYERRIIHSEIQNIEGVYTSSVGSDKNRKIVIYLQDKKPEGIFDETPVPEIRDMQEEDSGEFTSPDLTLQDSLNADDDTIVVKPTIPDLNDDIVDDGDLK